MTTRFVLRGGQAVNVPSALYSAQQLAAMLVRVGFKSSKIDVRTHPLPKGTSPLSPDITASAEVLGQSPYDLGILCTFTAES